MTHDPSARGDPAALRILWVFLGAAALCAGLYGRFKGIGTWSLGVDEFYISRSIDNVLRSGLPGFACGGYYTRGLLYQYAVAGLRLGGWSPEFAGRFAAAVSSLAVLPAAYLLARRLRDPPAGWLTVFILCISVWEIEMARFARMYAPFQAVFAWYVLAYLRFSMDRHAAALGWMIALSVLGVLVWEGGVLLGVANIFAILAAQSRGRLTARQWGAIAGLSVLLALLYLATRDLRGFTDPPISAATMADPRPSLHGAASWFAPLWQHPLWAAGLLLPAALAAMAAPWIMQYRNRPLLMGGLGLVLMAAALHAFLAAAGVLTLLLLTRLIDREALSSGAARYFWLALGAFLVFWLAAAAASNHMEHVAVSQLQLQLQLLGFPNVFEHVLKPWARTVPVLSAGLFAAFAYQCWIAVVGDRTAASPMAALLCLVIVLVLAVGATPTDRIETRYTFFLYPLLIVIAVCSILRAAGGQRRLRNLPILATSVLPLACFATTEDFQPRHVLDVDSARINFRVGMPVHRVEHYYPRNDIGGAGRWLTAHVRPGDVVIAGIPSLDQYYPHIDYFFLEETDERYETYVCHDGRTERWTNLPVLYTDAALKPLVAGHRVYASVYAGTETGLKNYAAAAGWSVRRVWTSDSGTADLVVIETRPPVAPAP